MITPSERGQGRQKRALTAWPHFYNTLDSVQLLSHVQLFATPWTAAHQASLSITNSWSLPKIMSTESVMPSNHLILCHPLLLLPSIFPSIRVFSNESVLRIRLPKDWSFSFNISPSNEYSGLISFRMDWLDLLAVQGTLKRLLQDHSLVSQGLSGEKECWREEGGADHKDLFAFEFWSQNFSQKGNTVKA